MLKVILLLLTSLALLTSCSSSNSVTTKFGGGDISLYRYAVFGADTEGDAGLDDILLTIQNDIADVLHVVSSDEASTLVSKGEKVLSPQINIKAQQWEGGSTFITVAFYDFSSNRIVSVVKSSGIGLTLEHDQKLACKAIRKELNKVFKGSVR